MRTKRMDGLSFVIAIAIDNSQVFEFETLKSSASDELL